MCKLNTLYNMLTFRAKRKTFQILFGMLVLWIIIYLQTKNQNNVDDLSEVSKLLLPNIESEIKCSALFADDEQEMKRAFDWMKNNKAVIQQKLNESEFENIECKQFLQKRQYVLKPLSNEETNFPLAFSVLVYKHVVQFERLLRAIYRPQNAYCIHVDLKAAAAVHKSIRRLASCFPANNVLVVDKPVDVRWGEYSVLEAELICFKELLDKFPHWKYIINLTGQEFPLRTHREIVRILTILNGANSMEGTVRRRNEDRVPKEKLEFPLTWFKGSVHILATRSFVDFIFSNPKAQRINQVIKDKIVPDEQFFSTLNHNPQLGTPGAYVGPNAETDQKTYHFIARLKNWNDEPFKYPCKSGRFARGICIWGVRDLPFIDKQFELFVNKFYWDHESLTLDCMEQRFWNRTYHDYHSDNQLNQFKTELDLNETFYKNLAIVKFHQ